jgi:hypothetical protein
VLEVVLRGLTRRRLGLGLAAQTAGLAARRSGGLPGSGSNGRREQMVAVARADGGRSEASKKGSCAAAFLCAVVELVVLAAPRLESLRARWLERYSEAGDVN